MDESDKQEMPVTGMGNPSLDADPIDESTDKQIDAALDAVYEEAYGEAEAQPTEPPTEPIAEPQTAIPQREVATQPTEPIQETPAPTAPEIDPEISAIEQPRNLSEKNQSNWRKLQETASQYKRQSQEAEALRQKLQEYEQKPPAPADYDELRKFRAIFDIQSDPDFQAKYDQPLNQAKHQIYQILKKHGASDEVIASIEKHGGPGKVDEEWWVNNAINKLPLTDSERLKRSLLDVSDLQEKRLNEIYKSASNANQYYQQKEQAAVEWFSNQEKEIYGYIQNKIVEQKADWAQRKEVPQNATPEQIKSIQAHNAQTEQIEGLFTSALWPKTTQERADVAAAAAMSHVLTQQLRAEQSARQRYQAQIKQLTEENAKIKGAGRMPRPNIGNASNKIPRSINDRLKMSSTDAIDLGLEEAGASL